MDIDFPFHADGRGRSAEAAYAHHVRDMIEQLVFTNPGERVNRPDFGSGLLQLIFAANFIASWFTGEKAEDNPWEDNSLEWAVSSPAAHGSN